MTTAYIIKINSRTTTYYKIGETKTDKDRPENLIQKYQGGNPEIIQTSIELPTMMGKRITDSRIRKALVKSKKYRQEDCYFIQSLTRDKDGSNEFIRCADGYSGNILEDVYKTLQLLKDDINNYTGKVVEDKILTTELHYDPTKKHYVTSPTYLNKFNQLCNFYNDIHQTILLIGQFDRDWVSSLAGYNDVYILYDAEDNVMDFNPTIKQKIKYATTLKGIFDMCTKFTGIIANPPYKIANGIISSVIDNAEFKVLANLMPISDYKKTETELFTYVDSCEQVDDYFDDAKVGKVLSICALKKNKVNKYTSYDELEMETFDKRFRKFYKQNRDRIDTVYYEYLYIRKNESDVISVKD